MGKSVALVLSSGGSRGLAHIGVINELVKQGFQITSVSGSSIGSVIGGLYAMGKLQEYTEWVRTLNKTDTILVDGGVLNPIPIEHVLRKNGDMLIVVNLYGEKTVDIPKEKNIDNGYLNRLMNTLLTLISTGDKSSKGYYSLLSSTASAMIYKIAKMNIEKHKPDLIYHAIRQIHLISTRQKN